MFSTQDKHGTFKRKSYSYLQRSPLARKQSMVEYYSGASTRFMMTVPGASTCFVMMTLEVYQ